MVPDALLFGSLCISRVQTGFERPTFTRPIPFNTPLESIELYALFPTYGHRVARHLSSTTSVSRPTDPYQRLDHQFQMGVVSPWSGGGWMGSNLHVPWRHRGNDRRACPLQVGICCEQTWHTRTWEGADGRMPS